jgi:valyl-tRNA synthetase
MGRKNFSYFYPTDVLVTGPDIIFFWVVRMIVASMEFAGEESSTLADDEIRRRVPFRDVYFTGIIRDRLGRKMSKSLGNSPEPFDLFPKYGADGVRLGLLLSAPSGQDLIFDEDNLALGRNFCNKLRNAFRFSRLRRNCRSYAGRPLVEINCRRNRGGGPGRGRPGDAAGIGRFHRILRRLFRKI